MVWGILCRGADDGAVVYKAGQGLQTMASLAGDTTSGGRQLAGGSWRERFGGSDLAAKPLKRNERRSEAGAGAGARM
jgi:hypothetical protein